ncbi:MAG: hypothetical protein K6E58_05410 [Eubacterium sp.]|nr:hypothetical protein [Eubacterium sp.]
MKRIIALVLTLAMVFTMAGFSQMNASAKVKKIKAKKKVTVQVGKSKTVKIKIKTTGKTKKAFTVKVSKKKIVKVKKKKGKIIIKGRKVGKCKITIRSKANKKKKKVIKVTVKAADAKLSVKQANEKVLALSFSKKVNLKESNVKIESKSYPTGNYKYTYKLSSFSTSDNKNYTVAVNGYFPEAGKVKTTVTGVNKKALVNEIDVSAPTYETTRKYYRTGTVGDEYDEEFDVDDYTCKGSGKVKSVSGLPAGIGYTEKFGVLRVKGTLKNTGVFISKILVEDEKGYVNTLQITFIVGSASTLVTYADRKIVYVSNEGGGYETSASIRIYTAGGSGSYTNKIVSKDSIFDNNIGTYYWDTDSTKNPGTYTGRYEVTDDYNTNLKATGTVVLEARPARLVKGKVYSASGKGVRYASVGTEQKTYVEGDAPYGGTEADVNGSYSFYLASGVYDIYASKSGKSAWVLNKRVTSSFTQNFKLDLYEVTLTADGVNLENAYDWEDLEDNYYYGDGNKIFMPKGTHRMVGWIYKDSSYKKVEATFTVSGDMTVKCSVKN